MTNEYFRQRAFFPTLALGLPMLSILCAAGGLIAAIAPVYIHFDGVGPLPAFSFAACLWRAWWLTLGAFGAYLGGRFLLIASDVRLGVLYPLAGAGVAAFMGARLLHGLSGSFGTFLTAWSALLFVAWFAVLDSLEPERGAWWRTVLLSLFHTKRRFR